MPDGSINIEETFESFYTLRGEPYDDSAFSGRSDYQAFINNGIPSGAAPDLLLLRGLDDLGPAGRDPVHRTAGRAHHPEAAPAGCHRTVRAVRVRAGLDHG